MTKYIVFVHANTESKTKPEEWSQFSDEAEQRGIHLIGAALIGDGHLVGNTTTSRPTDHIGSYMRLDADDRQKVLELLEKHPVVLHGGTVELCEMGQKRKDNEGTGTLPGIKS